MHDPTCLINVVWEQLVPASTRQPEVAAGERVRRKRKHPGR